MKKPTFLIILIALITSCQQNPPQPQQPVVQQTSTLTAFEQSVVGDWMLDRKEIHDLVLGGTSIISTWNDPHCHMNFQSGASTSLADWYKLINGEGCIDANSQWREITIYGHLDINLNGQPIFIDSVSTHYLHYHIDHSGTAASEIHFYLHK